MPFTFKVGESIKKGWSLYKENFWNIILFGFVIFLLYKFVLIELMLATLSNPSSLSLKIQYNIISVISGILIGYIWIKATLDMLDGKKFQLFSRGLFSDFSAFWSFIKTNLLIVLLFFISAFIISFGMSFLAVVIGKGISFVVMIVMVGIFIYVAIRLFPATYLSIDKKQGAVENIKEAWFITNGKFWMIIWKSILIGLFGFVGLLALLVGLIVTYPIAMIVMTMLYRSLVSPSVTPEMAIAPEIPSVEKPAEQVELKAETMQQ